VLRAHHGDLISHSKTAKHVGKMKSLIVEKQPQLKSFGTDTYIHIINIYIHIHTNGSF